MTLNEKAPGPTQRELSVACSQCADVSPVEVCVSVTVSVRVCIGLGGLIDFGEGDGCVSTGERVLRVLLCVFIEWACSLVWDWSSWGPFRAAPYLSPAESIRLQIWGPPSSCVSSFPFSGGPLGHCPSPGKG